MPKRTHSPFGPVATSAAPIAIALAAVVWLGAATVALAAPYDGGASPGGGATADWLPDDELLDRLLGPSAAGEPGAVNPTAPGPAAPAGQPAAGEDVGESPLASIVGGMREAASLLATDESTGGTPAAPVQKRVVADLERLIEQMEKQCQGGQCQGQKKPSSQRQASRRSKPKAGKPGEGDKPGDGNQPPSRTASRPASANRSGSTTLGSASAAEAPADADELVKAAWGHLPTRVRERMLQGADSEFLPAYRDELRAYFQRLAERAAEESP